MALGKLDTGAGVDNIDYVDATQLLYVAARKAARLMVAQVDDKGQLTVVTTGGKVGRCPQRRGRRKRRRLPS